MPVKRVERIFRNDLPKEDEMNRILDWIGKEERGKIMIEVENIDLYRYYRLKCNCLFCG